MMILVICSSSSRYTYYKSSAFVWYLNILSKTYTLTMPKCNIYLVSSIYTLQKQNKRIWNDYCGTYYMYVIWQTYFEYCEHKQNALWNAIHIVLHLIYLFVLYLKINCTSKNSTISFVSNIAIRPATFFLHHFI